MKILSLIIFGILFCHQTWAESAHIKLLGPKRKAQVRRIHNNASKADNELYKKVLQSNRELKQLLNRVSSAPVIWDGTRSILTGKVFKGLLLNSIVSTNMASPVLVKAYPNQGLPFGTLFSCKGATKYKRVLTICDKMITKEKEVPITAQILNPDGSAGLLGEYDDGKEDLISGAILSEVASGVLSVAQNKVSTPLGSYTDTNAKNQVLGGLIRGGQTTSDILLDEMKTKEPIVTINSGAEVLVYFMEGIHEY